MAIGDDAVAAGMAFLAGSTAANTLDTEIMRTRDYIAQHKHPATPIANGGTGSTTASAARTALGITPANIGAADASHTHISVVSGAHVLGWDGTRFSTGDSIVAAGNVESLANISASGTLIGGSGVIANSYNTSVAGHGGFRALYVAADGLYGGVTSSRRFKDDIEDWGAPIDAILALRVVSYRYKGDDLTDVGVIAEELHELGLVAFVDYDEDGEPYGVRYERLALALVPVLQDHEARIRALEGDR